MSTLGNKGIREMNSRDLLREIKGIHSHYKQVAYRLTFGQALEKETNLPNPLMGGYFIDIFVFKASLNIASTSKDIYVTQTF